jgi:hypothetical protein
MARCVLITWTGRAVRTAGDASWRGAGRARRDPPMLDRRSTDGMELGSGCGQSE